MARLARTAPERPDLSRLDPRHPRYAEILELHRQAVADVRDTYSDPDTGLQVMTASALWAMGRCCGCGCRHCPFLRLRERAHEDNR